MGCDIFSCDYALPSGVPPFLRCHSLVVVGGGGGGGGGGGFMHGLKIPLQDFALKM